MDAFCVSSGPQRSKCQHKIWCAGGPHSELAIGAVSPCSVLCWEKPRGSMARCDCCSGFQGGVAVAVKQFCSNVCWAGYHYGHHTFLIPFGLWHHPAVWTPFLPCSCLTPHPKQMFSFCSTFDLLGLSTIWIPSHPCHSQVLAAHAGLPLLPLSPTSMRSSLCLDCPPSGRLSPYLPHIHLTCLALSNDFRTELLREEIVRGRGRAIWVS